VEILTPYFGASGTGQLNAVFEVTPQKGEHIPKAQASAAEGYTAVSTRL
jgi:3,4-dihydroxyphenylacetate 2,3-dioxygenase